MFLCYSFFLFVFFLGFLLYFVSPHDPLLLKTSFPTSSTPSGLSFGPSIDPSLVGPSLGSFTLPGLHLFRVVHTLEVSGHTNGTDGTTLSRRPRARLQPVSNLPIVSLIRSTISTSTTLPQSRAYADRPFLVLNDYLTHIPLSLSVVTINTPKLVDHPTPSTTIPVQVPPQPSQIVFESKRSD